MTLIYSYTVGLRMVCSEHICIGQQRVFLCCCFIFQFVRVCWWCRVLCSYLQTAADIGCCRSGNECMEHVVWCKNHLLQQYLWPFSFYTSYKRQVSCFVTVASLHSLTCGPDMVIVTDLEDFHFCAYVLFFSFFLSWAWLVCFEIYPHHWNHWFCVLAKESLCWVIVFNWQLVKVQQAYEWDLTRCLAFLP